MGLRELLRGKPKEVKLKELSENFILYEQEDSVAYYDKPDHRRRSEVHQPNHKRHKEKVVYKRED